MGETFVLVFMFEWLLILGDSRSGCGRVSHVCLFCFRLLCFDSLMDPYEFEEYVAEIESESSYADGDGLEERLSALDDDRLSDASDVTPRDSPVWNETSSASDISSLSLDSHSGVSADSPRAVRARNHENRDSDVSLARLLFCRENFNRFHLTANSPPCSAQRHAWGIRKKVRLVDLVDDRKAMLRRGHVFMGFTQDGQFLISYTTDAPRSWMYPLGMGMFPEETHGGFKLHFWRFSPFSKKTKIMHSVKLFQKHRDFSTTAKIVMSQWPDDNGRIVVVGFWDESEAPNRAHEGPIDRNIAVSVVPVPTTRPSAAALPEVHTDLWLTEAPHPIFHPEYCMVIPDLLILHGGGLLLFYRFLQKSSGSLGSPSHSSHSGRKRKCPDDDLQTPDPSNREEIFCLEADDAVIQEIFYPSGESQIVDSFGNPVENHPLQEVFQQNGRPSFVLDSEALEKYGNSTVKVSAFRVDILMDKAWEFISSRINGETVFRKSFACETHSVDVLSGELILKACYFATVISTSDKVHNGKSRLKLRNVMVPFFLHVNFDNCRCRVKYYGNKTEENDVAWQKTEEQQHQIMRKLTDEVDQKTPRQLLRKVHSVNNFGVDRNVSLEALVTPDGCVMVTL